MENILLRFLLVILFTLTKEDDDTIIELDITQHPVEEFYTVPLYVGSLPEDSDDNKNYTIQTFTLQVDTTSSLSWIPSNKTTFPNITFNKYNSSLSFTGKETNDSIVIVDEDGDVFGNIIYDTVSLGNEDAIKVDNFTMIQILNYDKYFGDFPNGKLGLGYKNHSQGGEDSNFLSVLKKNNIISKKIFAIEKNKIIFGGIPERYTKYQYSKCNLTKTDDLDDEYRNGWICQITHLLIGDQTQNFEDAIEVPSSRVIFDSAYQYISIPMIYLNVFKEKMFDFYTINECKEIKEELEIYYVCHSTEKFSFINISFILEGYGYVFNLKSLFKKIDSENMEMLIRFKKENDNIWAFGLPFLNQYTIVYNAEDNLVGLYGGEKEDFLSEWELWSTHNDLSQHQKRKLLLIVGISVVSAIFLTVILFLLWKSFIKKKSYERKDQGPLIKSEEIH